MAKKVDVNFYRTPAGTEPVLDWLRELPKDDRKIIGEDILTVELGYPVGMPVCRPLGNGLYEVRSTIREGKVEARVYFVVIGSDMLLLNHQEGKSGQDNEIQLARQRLKDHKARDAAAKRKVKTKKG